MKIFRKKKIVFKVKAECRQHGHTRERMRTRPDRRGAAGPRGSRPEPRGDAGPRGCRDHARCVRRRLLTLACCVCVFQSHAPPRFPLKNNVNADGEQGPLCTLTAGKLTARPRAPVCSDAGPAAGLSGLSSSADRGVPCSAFCLHAWGPRRPGHGSREGILDIALHGH